MNIKAFYYSMSYIVGGKHYYIYLSLVGGLKKEYTFFI